MKKKRFFTPLFASILIFFFCLGGTLIYFNGHKNILTKALIKAVPPKFLPQNLNQPAMNESKKIEKSERSEKIEVNLVNAERFYTEKEIAEMTEVGFSNLLKTNLASLPKMKDISILPDAAVHHIPVLIMRAGKDISLLKDILALHPLPVYQNMASHFYERCAKQNDGLTTLRALCLTNLIELKRENNEQVNLKEYPKEIRELSQTVL